LSNPETDLFQFLFLVGLACLFPLSLYCLFLAMLHQRRHPTVISGRWDFAGVLIALSGFLLVGGTTMVLVLESRARDWFIRGQSWRDLVSMQAREHGLTLLLWGVYLLVLLSASLRQFRLRRKITSLYNIDASELEDVLNHTLDRLGLERERHGDQWLIGPKDNRRAILELDGSPVMRHVSLRWRYAASPDARAELAAELARDLAAYPSPESRTAGWFLTAGAALFTMMVFLLGTFLLILFR
jgi:hypothetical protein